MNRKWLVVIGVVAAAQVIQPDRSVRPNDPAMDLVVITAPTTEIVQLLHAACYDCHSDSTHNPWYSSITPVNFWLQRHVDEGREELDLSAWGTYSSKRQRHKAEEAAELISDGEMPLPSYAWVHGDARLTGAQRKALVGYFTELKEAIPATTEAVTAAH